jgi:predicted Rossmann fold flavoprotein
MRAKPYIGLARFFVFSIMTQTDLVIIGAGAAGLFAAGVAAEAGLRVVLLERRHRPGLKLLMCGNNRCNFSHAGSAEELLHAYGEPVASFLHDAICALPPEKLRDEFARMRLESIVSGSRIYPASGKADDVLHALTDRLRDREVPFMTNCPVESIQREADGLWTIACRNLTLQSHAVLLCAGGFSFPKTGSVGDGEKFSRELGLGFEPARAGLVAQELPHDDALSQLSSDMLIELPDVAASYPNGLSARGNLFIDRGLLRGSAIYDLNRQAARKNAPARELHLDLFPQLSLAALSKKIEQLQSRMSDRARLLNALGLPPSIAGWLAQSLRNITAEALKNIALRNSAPRSIKEAIVTVGGIARDEFDPATMECHKLPGLYAAGEVLDIDGPTGGYNLHAAFATGYLAVQSLARKLHKSAPSTPTPTKPQVHSDSKKPNKPTKAPMRTSTTGAKGTKSAWGAHFWDNRKGKRP